MSYEEIEQLFINTLNSEEKSITFVQSSLRSALDIYKQGGHVTRLLKDRIFRMHYDNRRSIIIPKDLPDKTNIDYSDVLLDSNPIEDLKTVAFYRYFAGLNKKTIYHKNTSGTSSVKSIYKSYLELAIRNFLKALLKDIYNLDSGVFENYKEIIDYIKGYDSTYNISINNLSQLKRRDNPKNNSVKRTIETTSFIDYIKKKFPNFDEGSFFEK
jgi:hypothetical protein